MIRVLNFRHLVQLMMNWNIALMMIVNKRRILIVKLYMKLFVSDSKDTLPTNLLEEKQPKQSEEMAARQYEDKEKVEEKTIDADKAETKAARNEECNLEREDRLQVEKEDTGEGKTNGVQGKKDLEQAEHDDAANATCLVTPAEE